MPFLGKKKMSSKRCGSQSFYLIISDMMRNASFLNAEQKMIRQMELRMSFFAKTAEKIVLWYCARLN